MADIPIAPVIAIRDAMTKIINDAGVASPPTPAQGVASPNGTRITAPTSDTIIDAGGHVWSFGALQAVTNHYNPGPDYVILRDGAPLSYGGAGQSMTIEDNVIFAHQHNYRGPIVYKNTGTGWQVVSGKL